MPETIVIIGAGPAGEAAAKTLRTFTQGNGKPSSEMTIQIIEKEEPGGLCLNKGCIPSKTLLEHVHKSALAKESIEWSQIQDTKREVVTGIREQLKRTLKSLKVDLIQGTASFESPSSVAVQQGTKKEILPFDKALIAAGTKIYYPPPMDAFKNDLLNSDTVLELDKTPESIVIVGGGAVGLEFACLLNAAGSKVTVVELKPGILPGEDPFVVSTLTRSLESRGISVKTGAKVKDLEKTASGWKITLSNGDVLAGEQVLACVGRNSDPAPLSLEKGGIKVDKNKIALNDFLQTANPNVYAAGDFTTATRLAHAASAQAAVAAKNILGEKTSYDDRLVPRCLYSWPEVASVGEWKYQREEKGLPVKAARAFFKGSSKALASGDTEGFVQVVSNPETGEILGAQIIGAHATELIHIFSVALKAGMTTNRLGDVIFAHPTLAEMVKEACRK